MDKSLYRALYFSVLIISVGFGIMELMDQQTARAALWLSCGALILIGMSLYRKKKENHARKSDRMQKSLLTEEQIERMLQGKTDSIQPETGHISLYENENVYWMDYARQDHYDGKEGILFLTDERIVFDNPDFSFSHPVHLINAKKTRNGFELVIRNRNMKFVSPSSEAFLAVFREIHG